MKIIKLKNTVSEMKNILNGFKSKTEMMKERVSELENKSIIIQIEEQKKKIKI